MTFDQKYGPASQGIRLGVVADVHYRSVPSHTTCEGHTALPRLRTFIDKCNSLMVDRVVDLGDHITQTDLDTDLAAITTLYAEYEKLNMPHRHIVGNHDIDYPTIADWEHVFGAGSFSPYSEDVKDFHLVYLNANAKYDRDLPWTLTERELDWLANDLAGTALPTIIFTHIPGHASSLKGNRYFQNAASGRGEYANSDAFRDVVMNSTTFLVLAGHNHWHAWHEEDDIYYVTLPALSETRTTGGEPSNSTTIVTVDDTCIEVEVCGREAVLHRMRRRQGSAVWL